MLFWLLPLRLGIRVAFDAKADDLLTLGFTSITAYSKLFGFNANCTLQPPSIFSAEIIFMLEVLNIWYSLSASVCDGATTMLSPVCTPTGFMFSMLHTVMQFPLAVSDYFVFDFFPA